MTDVGEVTSKVKENPLLNLGASKEKTAGKPADSTSQLPKQKGVRGG